MMHPLLLAAALVVAADASPAPGYDVFSKILSSSQVSQISRDSRCNDAKKVTDAFVAGKDPRTGVDALKELEKCASLSRPVGDWADYRDYVLTAAAAVAYEVGVLAAEPKAYERALKDLSYVTGYRAPATQTVVLIGKGGGDQAIPAVGQAAAGQAETDAVMPAQNNIRYQQQSTKVTGYRGTYGQLATEVGDAAQAALNSSRR